jgi:hypothetical protein
LITDVAHGALVLNPDGSFTYTPATGFVGEDTFTYSVTDGEIGAEPGQATVTITVRPPGPSSPPISSPLAPGLERIEFEISGCPALVMWTAEELGVDTETMEVWIAKTLVSTRNIQPCDACARLKAAAMILQDADGSHIAALAQVINDLASSTAPPTEEQMASIADAIARNSDPENAYTTAGAYLDALAEYVAVLNRELDLSGQESVEFVTTKYAGQLAETGNIGVAAYVAAVLADLAQ